MDGRTLLTKGLPSASEDVEFFNQGQRCELTGNINDALRFYYRAARKNTSNNHGTGAAIRKLKQYADAVLGFKKNASMIRACCLLARCYEKGYGTGAASELAIKYYKKVLEALFILHLSKLFRLDLTGPYKRGTFGLKELILSKSDNYIEDYDWILSVAESSTDKLLKYAVFRVLLSRHSPPAHYAGDQRAAFHLAVCYENGYGTARDFSKALPLYREAALAQNKKACRRLGEIYESGLNVPQNLVAAAEWYSAASATEKLIALAERNPTNTGILNVIADYCQEGDLERSIRISGRLAQLGNDVAMQEYTLAFQQTNITSKQFLSTLSEYLLTKRSSREIFQPTLDVLNTAIRTASPAISNKIKATLAVHFMEANNFVQAARFISGLDPVHLTPAQNLKIGTFLQDHCGDDFAIFQFVSTLTRLFYNGNEHKRVVRTLGDRYLTAAKAEQSRPVPDLKHAQAPPVLFKRSGNVSRCAQFAVTHSLRVSTQPRG